MIGFVLVKLFSSETMVNLIRHFFLRGVAVGAASGLLLYMVALVLGVTFTKSITITSIIVDVPWQIFEQMVGGFIISTVYALIYEPILMNRSDEKV
jgi:phosphotransferase system  glucose/maltose/N-acetylglucosamine-specific IIC component